MHLPISFIHQLISFRTVSPYNFVNNKHNKNSLVLKPDPTAEQAGKQAN